jgi:hypothetical protein
MRILGWKIFSSNQEYTEAIHASCLLKGKSYSRGVRCHTCVMEAMFRLQWCSFIKDLTEEDAYTEDDTTLASIASYVDACNQKQDVPQAACVGQDAVDPDIVRTVQRDRQKQITYVRIVGPIHYDGTNHAPVHQSRQNGRLST